MQIVSISVESELWLDFISSHAEANIFHHPNWIKLLVRCYGYTPYILAALNENGQIEAGLPFLKIDSKLTGRRIISLPFSDFCRPLVSDDLALNEFVKALQQWRKRKNLRGMQLRHTLEKQDGVYYCESVFHHLTTLTRDSERVYRNFNKSQVQRHIRQAEKLGVKIHWGTTLVDMNLFYTLHLRNRRRLGVPVQPKRFFLLLWQEIISQGLGFVLLAYKDNQILAGALFLHHNNTIIYKFGASDPLFWKFRPNDLLFWHAIRWGCENDYRVFDWGRTDLDNEGLRNFKRGWGADEQLSNYTILADQPPGVKFMKESQKRIMKAVIKHSPLWVCRLIGELLYVHFA